MDIKVIDVALDCFDDAVGQLSRDKHEVWLGCVDGEGAPRSFFCADCKDQFKAAMNGEEFDYGGEKRIYQTPSFTVVIGSERNNPLFEFTRK